MTEEEWNTCTGPQPMLEFLRGKVSDRKLRLFAVACASSLSHLLTDERSRKAVEIAESYVEGLLRPDELLAACDEAADACTRYASRWNLARDSQAEDLAEIAAYTAVWASVEDDRLEWSFVPDGISFLSRASSTRKSAALLLHELIVNPFRSIALDPSCLTATVTSLATAIYQERAFDRLPILADALEDAGCSNQEVLSHLRGGGEHTRGCWPLDLVLGKE